MSIITPKTKFYIVLCELLDESTGVKWGAVYIKSRIQYIISPDCYYRIGKVPKSKYMKQDIYLRNNIGHTLYQLSQLIQSRPQCGGVDGTKHAAMILDNIAAYVNAHIEIKNMWWILNDCGDTANKTANTPTNKTIIFIDPYYIVDAPNDWIDTSLQDLA